MTSEVDVPRFSVITPVHNPTVSGLRACADSMFAQSHTDWEWVICDDASSDGAVRTMLDDLALDERVTLIRRETNGGIVAATNDALSAAAGGSEPPCFQLPVSIPPVIRVSTCS
ncbi:MAG: glycosyltransferase [Ilumatobacteraceae bacterium]